MRCKVLNIAAGWQGQRAVGADSPDQKDAGDCSDREGNGTGRADKAYMGKGCLACEAVFPVTAKRAYRPYVEETEKAA